MSQTVDQQPAVKFDFATAMPLTAGWVKIRRREWGNEYVTDVIRRAMAGERNCFYAIEAGHIFGTPFDWEPKGQFMVSMSVLTGAKFLAAIRDKNKDRVTMAVMPPTGAKSDSLG